MIVIAMKKKVRRLRSLDSQIPFKTLRKKIIFSKNS
jgi:hypothetical protein